MTQALLEAVRTMNQLFQAGMAICGQYDEASITSATEDNVAPIRITQKRAGHINLRDSSGNELSTAGNPLTVQGPTAETNSVAGNPLRLGAADPSGNLIGIKADASGNLFEVAVNDTRTTSPTSPSSASTVASTTFSGIGAYRSFALHANIRGATGGVLDIYIQFSPDSGTTWVDYAHFAQLSAGAAAIDRVFSVTKGAQQTTITTVGTGLTPALAANTVIGGDWGDRLRIVFVAGASTSAGAAQNFKLIFSS